MAVDPTPSDDLQRLNALIDGQLPPAEHAALAARIAAGRDLAQAHATLARLKACIVDSVESDPVPVLPRPKAPGWKRPAGVAAAAVAAMLMFAIGFEYAQWASDDEPLDHVGAAIMLAALPSAPVVPDLAAAGLMHVGTEVETVAGTSLLVAAYRGPRGCRLELRVSPAVAHVPATSGSSRKTWSVGDLGYELVAFGMPAVRFATVAFVAEAATRAGRLPHIDNGRLREASRSAPPCVG